MKSGGLSPEQARALASAIVDALSMADIATRYELTELATKADIRMTRAEFRVRLANAETRLLKWVVGRAPGAQAVAILGTTVALVQLMR
jgi:hypothetical protein